MLYKYEENLYAQMGWLTKFPSTLLIAQKSFISTQIRS